MEKSEEFTSEELNIIEGDIPGTPRSPKIKARAKLTRELPPLVRLQKDGLLLVNEKITNEYANAGGKYSELDPINPSKIRDMGEPTVEIKITEDNLKVNNN